MGWRFRQSFTVIPGVRLNLSKSGLSASIGGAPFTLNVGPRGVVGTASIPGTGLSVHHRFTTDPAAPIPEKNPVSFLLPRSVPSHSLTIASPTPIEVVHSAGTELLT